MNSARFMTFGLLKQMPGLDSGRWRQKDWHTFSTSIRIQESSGHICSSVDTLPTSRVCQALVIAAALGHVSLLTLVDIVHLQQLHFGHLGTGHSRVQGAGVRGRIEQGLIGGFA